MANSYPIFKDEIKNRIIESFGQDTEILDVGPGMGVYSDLLYNTFKRLDAIEVFPEYIKRFKLESKYREVIEGNINDFDFSKYDLLIMGDVLEHLTIEDATKVLKNIEMNNQSVIVSVPYLLSQQEVFGNVYEIHLQTDLTPEVMAERYPSLKLIYGNSLYGYYSNKN